MGDDATKQTSLTREELILGPRLAEVSASSTGGDLVAFTQKVISDGGKSAATNLWLHNATSKRTVQMTRLAKGGVSNPAFSLNMPGADDAVMFNKEGQIWALPLEGGESSQVTAFDAPVECFKIFRGTGTKVWLLCVLSVFPGLTPTESAAKDKEREGGGSAMLFDRLMVRHWDTWNCYEKRNHLFLCQLDVQENGMLKASADKLHDTMLQMHTDCPAKPFGGSEEFEASPDGECLAMACRRVEEDNTQSKETSWSTCVSVFVLTIPPGLSEMTQETAAADADLFQWQMASATDNHACATSPSWSPDSKHLSYLTMHREKYESDHLQIYVWNRSTKERTNISADIDLSFGSVLWDSEPVVTTGSGIVAPKAAGSGSLPQAGQHETIAHAATSAMEGIAAVEEVEPEETQAGSYTLYVTAQYRASMRIFRLGVDTHHNGSCKITSNSVLVGEESRAAPMLVSTVNAFTGKNEKLMFFVEGSLSSPNVLKCANIAQKNAFTEFIFSNVQIGEVPAVDDSLCMAAAIREVHCPNPQFFNGDLQMPQLRQLYFASKDAAGNSLNNPDDLVHCWYLPPTGFQTTDDETSAPKASVPLVLIIHGGPQGAIMNAWNYRWNLAYYASLGYGVVAVNFHGSSGFGVKYLDSIRGDWGGQPYRDCMECTEFILNQYPYLNRDKVGALGASYGGYMVNWINGHDSKGVFKCLVNHDGIFGLKNLYYTTEEQWFPEWEFGLPYVTNPSDEANKDSRYDLTDESASKTGPSQYDLFDPALFVDQWNTPTLVIQGCKDYRVVETEGIATFTALQRRGIESKFLVFPDENHWCLKAQNSMQWYGTVTDWLRSHLD